MLDSVLLGLFKLLTESDLKHFKDTFGVSKMPKMHCLILVSGFNIFMFIIKGCESYDEQFNLGNPTCS